MSSPATGRARNPHRSHNLEPACGRCNHLKADQSVERLRTRLKLKAGEFYFELHHLPVGDLEIPPTTVFEPCRRRAHEKCVGAYYAGAERFECVCACGHAQSVQRKLL